MTYSQTSQYKNNLLGKLEHFQSQDSNNQSLSVIQTEHHYDKYYEYILSLVGFAVGFGSFWRFPYLVYKNGGGVFLIPYLLALVLIGIPMIYLETAIGQMHQKSLPFIFSRIHKGLKYVGIIFMIQSLHISGYYNIILTYSYRFIFSAFNNPLPFSLESPTDNRYFTNVILHKSSSIEQFGKIDPYLFILFIVSLLICYLIIKNGVKTSGKVVLFTALIPYFFFLILLVRGIFLNGAFTGLTYLFSPNWSKLFGVQIWVDAIVQVFFQTSVAIGGIVNLASLKPKKQTFIESVYIIPLSILVCGILCALNVFMYLGHFSMELGISINDLKLSGPQLSFNIFPKALAILPWANLWIFLFFVALVFLGIDTQFTFLETVCCYLKDEDKYNGIKVLGVQISLSTAKKMVPVCIMIFCPFLTSSAGIYYMQYFDTFIVNAPLSAAALLQLYVFVYLFPFKELQTQTQYYLNATAPPFIKYILESKFLLVVLTINLILALTHQVTLIYQYPFRFYFFGWLITIYPYIFAYLYWARHQDDTFKLTFHQIKQKPYCL